MENNTVALKEGQPLMSENERKVFEQSIRRCNKCRYASFKTRSCRYDRNNPKTLNTYENTTGYVFLLKPKNCPFYQQRGDTKSEQ